VTERLSSGEYFNRLQWSAFANYSESGQASGGLIQRSTTGELSYALDHGISVVGDVGYQWISTDFALANGANSLSGAIYLGGLNFNWAKLTGSVRAGEQYKSFSVTGNLSYEITPRLSLSLNAQDGVNAPGAGGFGGLGGFGGFGGGFGGFGGGLGALSSPGLIGLGNVLGLSNSVARIQAESAALGYTGDDYTMSLSAYNQTQDTETTVPTGLNGDLRSQGFFVNLGRQFASGLNVGISAGIDNQTLLVGSSTGLQFQAHASYALVDGTSLYTYATYFERGSSTALSALSPDSGDVSSVAIGVGITHQFF
jgi:hypothetical protein